MIKHLKNVQWKIYLYVCEIQALEVENLVFVSWTPQETNVFIVRRDESLCEKAMIISNQMYCENKKKPTKLSDDQRLLELEIANKKQRNSPCCEIYVDIFYWQWKWQSQRKFDRTENSKETIEGYQITSLKINTNSNESKQVKLWFLLLRDLIEAGKRTRSEVHRCAGFQ